MQILGRGTIQMIVTAAQPLAPRLWSQLQRAITNNHVPIPDHVQSNGYSRCSHGPINLTKWSNSRNESIATNSCEKRILAPLVT